MDDAERYILELARLNEGLVMAVSAGQFRQAGKFFTRIVQLQHAAGVLTGRPELEAIQAELDEIPSRVLGARQ